MRSILLLFTTLILFTGCSENDSAKTCDNCLDYEQCNTNTGTCDLKTNMCHTKTDCNTDQICNNTHQCIVASIFDCNRCDTIYQQCNSEKTACELKPGKCDTKDDCSNGELCNESNSCYTPELFDCNICKDYQQCNGEKSACELKAGKCDTKNDCSDDQLCNEDHTCTTPTTDDTIYTIRTGNVAVGTTKTVSGIVTGIKLDGSGVEGIYIQEPGVDYRGIFIYIIDPAVSEVKIGDEITITGIYEEYNNLSEIKIDTPTVITIKPSTPITNYTQLATTDLADGTPEPYESMLVSITDSFVAGTTDSFGNTVLTNPAGKEITIRNDCFDYTLLEGDKLTKVRGVLTYNFNEFKILPQSSDDLVDQSILCDAASCGDDEICTVTNNIASCSCDKANGYFGTTGNCNNPCIPNSCTETHKTLCTPSNSTDFTCNCDSGFQDNEGICEAIPSCDPTIYSNAFGKTGTSLETALLAITSKNHESYGYEPAKRAMFSHIDNEGGHIRGVYTGEYYDHPYNDDRDNQTKTDENKFNCEHTWPQSMGISGTSKADLHHLFPSFSTVNSKRGNHPFGEVTGGEIFGTNNYFSEMKNSVFEPADQHKGNVARAMLYMMVRYDNPSNFIESHDQFNTFKAWDKLDPVDDAERTRNNLIETYQGNRNPFIDCPQFVDALYE